MKKFDEGYIYSHLLSDFLSSIVLLFLFFDELLLDGESEELLVFDTTLLWLAAVAFAVIYACFIVYRVLYYRTSGYELTERELRCKRGVLFRKHSVLEYHKIHAINKKQTLIHKLFGIAVLTVDSGSANTAHQAEITIVEKARVVDALLQELHVLREGGVYAPSEEPAAPQTLLDDSDRLYRFTSKRKLVYTAVSVASTAVVTLVLGVLSVVAVGFLRRFATERLFDTLWEYVIGAGLLVVGVVLFCSAISVAGCLVQSFVGYHNFCVTKRQGDIEIAYGLLERHTNTFSFDRIKAVKITQSFMQRLFGFAAIKLEVIGYTAEAGEDHVQQGLLVPFCRVDEVDALLARLLPDYVPQPKQATAPLFFPFVSWFLVIFGGVWVLTAAVVWFILFVCGVSAAVMSVFAAGMLGAALMTVLIKFLHAHWRYKTCGLAYDDTKVTAYSGGFSKTVTVFKTKHLVAVEQVTTPLRQKAGVATAVFHVRTNALTNEVKVPLQESALIPEFEKRLTV